VGVAYDPVQGELFVANSEDNNVSVISDVNDSVVATVSSGSGPIALAYDSSKGEVFVANAEDGTVSVIEPPVIPATTTSVSLITTSSFLEATTVTTSSTSASIVSNGLTSIGFGVLDGAILVVLALAALRAFRRRRSKRP
jgi:YVTN family beta-propeller protein